MIPMIRDLFEHTQAGGDSNETTEVAEAKVALATKQFSSSLVTFRRLVSIDG
jgi:hypothetical protein